MSENSPPDPLSQLGAEIDKARQERLRQQTIGRGGASRGAMGVGFRIATELVAALCVGVAFGWLAFRFLPAPWGVVGLIAFFLLGAAAGMVNVFRAAKSVGYGGASPSAGAGNRSKQG
jgi:ATP synthase protein I